MTSKSRSLFLLSAKLTLVLVYAVILAGSVVRATGSGMGCPDWPKCFGHYIPPTQLEQLEFGEGKRFEKGQFIIHQRALWKAKHDMVAGPQMDMADWEKYTKHDYAIFNPAHTWTEYINRLAGALLGFASLIMLGLSLPLRRESWRLPALSALAVFLIGFEAWLGATVVESNLEPAKITVHMIGAIIIVAVVMAIIWRSGTSAVTSDTKSARIAKVLVATAIVATVVQIVMGTQVREMVDELDKTWNGANRDQWVNEFGVGFQVHRFLGYAIVALNVGMALVIRKYEALWPRSKRAVIMLLSLLLLEWVSGVILVRFALPAFIQPLHLVMATVIFGLQVRLWQDVAGLTELYGTKPLEAAAGSPLPQVATESL